VQGIPAAPSVLAIDGPIDVAVIAVRADDVMPALKECAAKGVGAAVILSAGFREAGPDGAAREAELRAWLAGQTIRVVGPNTLGWIRPAQRANLSFAAGSPTPGPIGFFSQSGAVCTAIIDWARGRDIGFSLFASLGNQADVCEGDVIAALADDPATTVIAGYIEGVADGRRFFEVLRAAACRKPCVLIKAGRSASGARAVSSHTGALAGTDRVFDAAVREAGARRAHTMEELFDLAAALAKQPLPRDRRIVIVTNGGGPGILAADAASALGLTVEALPDEVTTRLRAVLPSTASITNPIDLIGDADAARYGDALRALGDCGAATLVVLTPQAATDAPATARAIRSATRDWSAPVLASFLGGTRVEEGIATLRAGGVPCFPFPERAVQAIAAMAELAERRMRRADDVTPPAMDDADIGARVAALVRDGCARLGMLECAALLTAAGVPTLATRLARTPDEVRAITEELAAPVALKIVSPQITHKSDVGGVVLNVASADDAEREVGGMLARVAERRPDATVDAVLVQPMADMDGVELVVGAVRDPQFGPVVMVGLGGIYVEIVHDVAMRLAPVGRAEARRMLAELALAPVLGGARGRPPVALDPLADTIVRIGALLVAIPELAEIEINPLVARADGVTAIDARGTLR
jgi:acetyltransferase